MNHKEPANDLAPKNDLTGGGRTKTFGTDKPDRPQQGLPREGGGRVTSRLLPKKMPVRFRNAFFQSNALSPIYGDDQITEI